MPEAGKDSMKKQYKVLCITLFALLFLLPVILTLTNAKPGDIKSIACNPYYRKIMWFSVYQALLSALLSLAVGLPGAWILANTQFKGKKSVKSIYGIPFILPSVLVVLGFVIFYGNNGLLSKLIGKNPHILYSFKAILLAHVFYNFPVVTTIVGNAMEKLDSRIEESARNCGAGELKIFFEITMPRLLKSVLSACCIVFLLCLSSFAIILILGGSPKLSTMEVEIYRLAKMDMDISKASSLCIYSTVITAMVLFLQNTLTDKTNYTEETVHSYSKKLSAFSFIYLILSVLFILCPVFSIVLRSFTSASSRAGRLFVSLSAYKNIDLNCLLQTFLIALGSASVSTVLALGFMDYRGILTMLPLVISSAIIGLGYLILCVRIPSFHGALLIMAAHSVINMPFALKTIKNVHDKIPNQYKELACLEGSTDKRYFLSIELPILKNAIISSFLLCFSLSAGELNATAILGSSKTATIPMQIKHMISSYNYQGACALGTVLTILSFTVYFIGEKLKERD